MRAGRPRAGSRGDRGDACASFGSRTKSARIARALGTTGGASEHGDGSRRHARSTTTPQLICDDNHSACILCEEPRLNRGSPCERLSLQRKLPLAFPFSRPRRLRAGSAVEKQPLDFVPWMARQRRRATVHAVLGLALCLLVSRVHLGVSGHALLPSVAGKAASATPWAMRIGSAWMLISVCVSISLQAMPEWWTARWAREQTGKRPPNVTKHGPAVRPS